MIYLRNGSIPVADLTKPLTFPVSEYELEALEFCKEWISGKSYFNLQTSGSTGIPKEIIVLREQMLTSALMTAKALELKKGENAFACLNVRYIAGKMMLVRALSLEMNLYITEPSSHPFGPLGFPPIDFIALVPLQLSNLLKDKGSFEVLNRCKNIIVGGAPISLELIDEVQELESNVYSTFGMTETVSHIALKKLNGVNRSDYYKVLPGISIGTDIRGCLTITSALTSGEQITTNDIVEIKNELFFKWLGRIDNILNSGGYKIVIEQLEQRIETIFKILEIHSRFFICALPDQRLGDKVCLVIESSDQLFLKLEHLKNLLKEKLEKYSIPREIMFMDRFSETPTGKIDRKKNINKITT